MPTISSVIKIRKKTFLVIYGIKKKEKQIKSFILTTIKIIMMILPK